MPRTKHAAMVGNERAGSSRSSADHSGEPDYFFRNPECAEKSYNDFSKRKVMLGRKVNVESLLDFEIECPFVKRTSRNIWVPKHQDSDENEGVALAEAKDELEGEEDSDEDEGVAAEADELEGEEVDAEAMEFDVDADLADDPPIIPSLPEFRPYLFL
ncbi:hypothetical protein CJ030_MR4G010994 [Morella rubra]|uniref:Uncharacterized protein n=1 Tax=Morella rubra TaxID=262757 RepID=A0A6A1VSJ3_9ROSI|nr:hypothetical protein CJ030_MR4G010994 [Morella rubra]